MSGIRVGGRAVEPFESVAGSRNVQHGPVGSG